MIQVLLLLHAHSTGHSEATGWMRQRIYGFDGLVSIQTCRLRQLSDCWRRRRLDW